MIGIFLLVFLVVSVAVFRGVYVRCPSCSATKVLFMDQWVPRWSAFVERREDFYQDGWVTVREQVDTDTNFYDTKNRLTGTGRARSFQNRTVPSRTVYYTSFYSCPDCKFEWERKHSSTFRL